MDSRDDGGEAARAQELRNAGEATEVQVAWQDGHNEGLRVGREEGKEGLAVQVEQTNLIKIERDLFKSQLDATNALRMEMSRKIGNLKDQLQAAETHAEYWQEQCRNAQADEQALRDKINKINDELSHCVREIDQVRNERDSLRSQLDATHAERAETGRLRSRVAELYEKVQSLQAELRSLEADNVELLQEAGELTGRLRACDGGNQTLTAKLSDARKYVDELSGMVVAEQRRNSTLTEELIEARKDGENACEDVEKLTGMVADEQKRNSTLIEQIKLLQRAVDIAASDPQEEPDYQRQRELIEALTSQLEASFKTLAITLKMLMEE